MRPGGGSICSAIAISTKEKLIRSAYGSNKPAAVRRPDVYLAEKKASAHHRFWHLGDNTDRRSHV
jgi:hypothetical protein